MSLIFESVSIQKNPNVTATHVLLVGCGEYPHLAAVGFGGLKSLTSPQLSAGAMANWFLSGPDAMPIGGLPPEQAFHNPDAPLGSLVMLTSPEAPYQAPFGGEFQTTRPTLINIRTAYSEWLARLGSNPNSRGVFHFCGHGVSDGISQYLVADDFGISPDDPWSGVFHVSNTCQTTIRKTAASLFFLIDACMELSEDLINEIDTPKALISGQRNGPPQTTEWAVLRATTANRLAFAPNNGVARFTNALLKALRGHCGKQRAVGVGFDVGVSELRDATAAFLEFSQQSITGEHQKLGMAGGEGNWTVAMHVQQRRPSVLVDMDVQPEGYRPVACAFMEDTARRRESKELTNGPVQFVKEQGEWSYGTNAKNNVYAEQYYGRQFLTSAVHTCRFRIP
ncbi:caspase family protein [Shewanella sp. AS16]|uniref:caspase family protein n=1 Tax=Shewanella sp. AS16 TaxID=2907625 RepID=UPI001F45EE1E|nr:caspase family protein [Shewanella sp. AS16]MCE9685821.1 caspase family protein [Shewanella sp. AS16]